MFLFSSIHNCTCQVMSTCHEVNNLHCTYGGPSEDSKCLYCRDVVVNGIFPIFPSCFTVRTVTFFLCGMGSTFRSAVLVPDLGMSC